MSALDYLRERARVDPVVFVQVVVKDEITGQPLELTDSHKDMLRFWHSHDRTVLHACPEFGKSTLLTAYTAFRLGQDPSLRVAYISGTQEQAQRHVHHVTIHLSRPEYGWVYPGRAIERATTDSVWLQGRPETMKDPSLVSGAPSLSSMQGRRAGMVCADDIVPLEAVHSQTRRDVDTSNFHAIVSSRLTPDGQIHCIGTAEHPDDLLHRLAKLQGYQYRKYPVLDAAGRPTFPARWPADRVEKRRLELGPVKAMASLFCEASSEAALCFRQEDLDRALAAGLAMQYESAIGGRCVIGVDPSWVSKPGSDESGIVMVTLDADRYRHLVHVSGQRLHHEQLVARCVELARINKAAAVYVESNGAGALIADAIGKQVPCKPLSTSRQSKESRIEALSAELASGRWVFRQPLGHPDAELRKLIGEMQVFSFDRHCGDRLAALLIAVEGVRATENRPRGGMFHTYTRPDGGLGLRR